VCVVVLYCILLNSVSLGRGRPRRRWGRRQRRGGDGFLCLLCTLTTAADALTARRVSKRASVSYEDVRGANPSQSFSSINDAVKRQWRHPHSLVLKSNSKVTTPICFYRLLLLVLCTSFSFLNRSLPIVEATFNVRENRIMKASLNDLHSHSHTLIKVDEKRGELRRRWRKLESS